MAHGPRQPGDFLEAPAQRLGCLQRSDARITQSLSIGFGPLRARVQTRRKIDQCRQQRIDDDPALGAMSIRHVGKVAQVLSAAKTVGVMNDDRRW
jgi:hypothetical protein